MNLLINLENIQIDLKHIFSVKLNIYDLNLKTSEEYIKKIYSNDNSILFELDNNFLIHHDYIIIYSIMQFGKQIDKKRLAFTYPNCDEYKIENLVISNSNSIKKSKDIKILSSVSERELNNKNIYIDLTPIAVIRDVESEFELYINGNILYLKSSLYLIVKEINNDNNLFKIFNKLNMKEKLFLDFINLLNKKGVVVVYEK